MELLSIIMVNCPNCGAELEKKIDICPYCKDSFLKRENLLKSDEIKSFSKKIKKFQSKNSKTILNSILLIWKEAITALKSNQIDRFFRKLGAAVEKIVIFKHNLAFSSDPPNIKWGMKNLRELGIINERQSDLNWLWDIRNEFTHSAIDPKLDDIKKALKVSKSIIIGCLNN